jgi:beta-phosphoglucomutase-like phosphatase (HAD superfamily)
VLERFRRREPALMPDQVAVLEDSAHGIAAARAAGMVVLAFRKPYADGAAQARAHRVVSGFHEIDLNALLED